MQTATRDPNRQIVFNRADRTWTALYAGQIVQVGLARHAEAEQALDEYVYQHLRHHGAVPENDAPEPAPADIPIDPLSLYAPVGPFPLQPVTDAALERAYALFTSEYGDRPELLARTDRALALARNRSCWRIPAKGVLRVQGSLPGKRGEPPPTPGANPHVWYEVCDLPSDAPDAQSCETTRACMQHRIDPESGRELAPQPCPDHTYRTPLNGNQCKHLICRELIRLAQIFASEPAAAAPASVTVGGRILGLSLSIAYLSERPTTIQIAPGHLLLTVGAEPLHTIDLGGLVCTGVAAVELSTSALGKLWGAFRPLATRTPELEVRIDPRLPGVVLRADEFQALAYGWLRG